MVRKRNNQFMQQPIYIHLLAVVIVFVIIIFIVLKGLDVYTLHNQTITVPAVKGLSIEEASVFLKNSELRYQVIDSIYSNEVKPGTIAEMIPTFGSKVKRGRIIFITLNAKNAQSAAIPDVKNMSYREAYSRIRAQGFTSVTTKYIPGRYKDLVIDIELNGRSLESGIFVPLSSALILTVSDGTPEIVQEKTEIIEEN